jgi:small ligand-binding sensory domain FIST
MRTHAVITRLQSSTVPLSFAMHDEHSVAAHWPGDFDEEGLQAWAEQLRARLRATRVSLGLVFMSSRFFSRAAQVLEILRVHGQIPLLAGCSSESLIAGEHEFEENAGLALALYALPDVELKAIHFTQENVEAATSPEYWPSFTGVSAAQTNGWLIFADPFHLDSESWLKSWNDAYAPLPALGGLAAGPFDAQQSQVYLNGEVFEEGGVAISVGGGVSLAGIVSQGCMPIGDAWTLTRVEGNVIHKIGNRPAYEVLVETFSQLAVSDQKKARGNLFIGLVINEYLEEFHQGDFLVRPLLVADPHSGAIAVGALPRTGQTVQFQRRDAAAANDDLLALLKRFGKQFAGTTIYGACLCCCNGRGRGLFNKPDHDARMVQEHLGPMGMAGFFCNGEIGPVGKRNFLHGYTASLALFVKK